MDVPDEAGGTDGAREPAWPDLAGRLRRAGLRVTSQRLAVMHAVAQQPHSTADQVLGTLAGRSAASAPGHPTPGVTGPGISRQAVYDVLSAGVAAGLLRRIEPAGSPARYETRTGDNHHHLICRVCGRTADVDCATGSAPCLHPGSPGADTVWADGFLVEEAEIVFWGRCAACARTGTPIRPSP